MPARKKTNTPEKKQELLDVVIQGMQEKKAKNIVCLDMKGLKNAICNYFVICSADNHRQVQAIADSIEEFTFKKLSEKPWHSEGRSNANWILLDYVDLVAHVFYTEYREFYNIENLWADAKKTEIESN